jgi:hypothetical protein
MVDFPKTLFNASELLTISPGFRKAVSPVTDDTTVQKLTALITSDESELKSAVSKGQTSKYSSSIEELDTLCDSAYCTFRNLAKTNSEQKDDPAIAEAATVIVTILRNVNWNLHRLGYKNQLTQLGVLDEKLSAPAAKQALETAGLTKWYDYLRAATKNLADISDKRVDEKGENDLPLTKESQVKLYGHLLKLYNHIDTQEELIPDIYVPVAHAIDAVLNIVTPEARRRQASGKPDSKNVEQPTPTTV